MYLSPGDATAIRLLEHSTVVMLRVSLIKNVSPDGSAQHVDTEERGGNDRESSLSPLPSPSCCTVLSVGHRAHASTFAAVPRGALKTCGPRDHPLRCSRELAREAPASRRLYWACSNSLYLMWRRSGMGGCNNGWSDWTVCLYEHMVWITAKGCSWDFRSVYKRLIWKNIYLYFKRC